MLNWWLILLIVVIPILCAALTVWTIFYFQSPDDKGTAWVPKAVFGLGMMLALGSVLLIPFDLANSPDPTVVNKYNQTLNGALMWEIVLWMMAAMALLICPFTMFFYEAEDPERNKIRKQIIHSVIMTLVPFGVFAIVTGVCYAFVGVALVPYESFGTSPQLVPPAEDGDVLYNSTFTKETLELKVTFTAYTMGMLCFLGWIGLVFYGGAGILSYPIVQVKKFVRRPKAISSSRFVEEMSVVLAKADALLEMGLQLQQETRGKMPRSVKSKINVLHNEVYLLEAHEDQLIWAYTKAGGSPFVVYGKLVFHIICFVTGIVWILQIFVYNTFDAAPLLNTLLIQLHSAFPLFGIVAYAVLAFYLQWATFQGQILLGLRLVFFQIHPMKRHDTLVNSFLFNASLLLVTAFAVVELVIRSFQDYAPYTAISGLMNGFVLQLKGIGQIIRWAPIVFVGFSLLALVLTLICFKRKKVDVTKIRLN